MMESRTQFYDMQSITKSYISTILNGNQFINIPLNHGEMLIYAEY